VIHLLELFSSITLTAWAITAHRRSFTVPGPRGVERRAMWSAITLLAVSQILYGHTLRPHVDDLLGVGWAKALADLAVVAASGYVLRMLHLLLNRPERVHRRARSLTVMSGLLCIGPFLFIPPRTAHLFEPSPAALAHWVGVLPLLTWALACACTVWPRHARQGPTPAVRLGMWLIAIGNAVGLLWVLGCVLTLLAVFAVNATAFERIEELQEALSALSKSIIVIGVAWPTLARVSARGAQVLENRTINAQVRQLRPFWAELATAAPSKVHFPAATRDEPRNGDEADFQRTRMITEIQDIRRLAGAYVSVGDFRQAHAAVRSFLPAEQLSEANIIASHICLRWGLRRQQAQRPRSSHPAPELHVEGETVAIAAKTFLQELRVVDRHRVLLQSLSAQLKPDEVTRP
jgi:hypothetical protein